MRDFSGACVRRVIDRSRVQVPEHSHDWPVLSLFVLGAYRNETEIGASFICGPSAIFYRAGAAHRNTIAATGFEQIEIEFDPAWLGRPLLPAVPVVRWIGGRPGARVRDLAHTCATESSELRFREALQQFMHSAARQPARQPAEWVGTITRRLREDTSLKIADLAVEVQRHPAWIGPAYRRATGEGTQEAAARFRVERATCLLRETDQPYASIAFETGFCDQSHMNRTFRRVLGRSPAAVRRERASFRQIPA